MIALIIIGCSGFLAGMVFTSLIFLWDKRIKDRRRTWITLTTSNGQQVRAQLPEGETLW